MRFTDPRCATFIVNNMKRLQPEYWANKPGGAFIITQMAKLRSKVIDTAGSRRRHGGYMFVKRLERKTYEQQTHAKKMRGEASWL